MTKSEFLHAFKTTDKYIKAKYIEQETFYNNMFYVMGVVKGQMTDESKRSLEVFDAQTFTNMVVSVLKTMGPERWRKIEVFSEQMRAEAKSHFFAAGTDVAGIAIGKGIGNSAKTATKLLSRPQKTAVALGSSSGNRFNMKFSRYKTTNDVSRVDANIHLKTKNNVWGTNILDFRKIKRTDINIDFSLDPIEIAGNQVVKCGMDTAHQKLAPGGKFSYGDTDLGKTIDFVTDYLPMVGSAKAVVSAVGNFAVGVEYFRSASRLEKMESMQRDATLKFFHNYVYADIEKDLKSLDKKTLFMMMQFVLEADSVPFQLSITKTDSL